MVSGTELWNALWSRKGWKSPNTRKAELYTQCVSNFSTGNDLSTCTTYAFCRISFLVLWRWRHVTKILIYEWKNSTTVTKWYNNKDMQFPGSLWWYLTCTPVSLSIPSTSILTYSFETGVVFTWPHFCGEGILFLCAMSCELNISSMMVICKV